MKAAIVSSYQTKPLAVKLKHYGFLVTNKNPDFILCYGGDGTILAAERMFPGTPKLAVKHTNICHRCELGADELDMSLEKIRQGKFSITEQIKLEASAKGKMLVGLNEIQVRMKTPIQAIRFSLHAGSRHFENLIGDGVIVATPFGSTAYYRSTGGRPFKEGIGISFNNLHPKPVKSFVIPDNSSVEIKVDREPAYLIADNNEKFIPLASGDRIVIKKSKQAARFIQL